MHGTTVKVLHDWNMILVLLKGALLIECGRYYVHERKLFLSKVSFYSYTDAGFFA